MILWWNCEKIGDCAPSPATVDKNKSRIATDFMVPRGPLIKLQSHSDLEQVYSAFYKKSPAPSSEETGSGYFAQNIQNINLK